MLKGQWGPGGTECELRKELEMWRVVFQQAKWEGEVQEAGCYLSVVMSTLIRV